MTVTVANLPYSFCPSSSAQSNVGFMFKNAYDAWYYSNSTATATQITDIDYPGYHAYSCTLTSAGTTATAVVAAGHGLSVGDSVTIAGATQTEYNGDYSVATVADSTHFTYTFAGSATTPATGTITATGGAVTVPGIVFIDGYFVVMDTNGILYTSGLNDATAWNALDFAAAQEEPGSGKAIGKTPGYVIAFKEWDLEPYYDAANAIGLPLSPVQNQMKLIGCASGDSLANLDGMLFWVSQTRQKGRGVHVMFGIDVALVSTPDIERILNLSTLETVYSFGVKIAGHTFYVLTLTDQNITLVYDAITKLWAQWSSLTLGTPVSVTSITLSGTTATVTATAHGLVDGDPVLIAGADQAVYNGIKVSKYIDANSFSFETTAGTTTPATGTITSTPYTETYFKYTKYIHALGKDLLQHESDGTLAELVETAYQDVGKPVNVVIRTGKIDGGTTDIKRFASFELIGNKANGTAYVRHSDDDYVTNSTYRTVDLSADRSIIRRLGAARRRSFEIKYLDNTALLVGAADIEVV